MIQTETITTKDGRELIKTYSDDDHYIIQDSTNKRYISAVDPADAGRTYTESEELIKRQTPRSPFIRSKGER